MQVTNIKPIRINVSGTSMRYGKDEKLLKLAMYMQGDSFGRSLQDIQTEFEVGRRTAERMRDVIERCFPQMEQAETGERIKRWKLPSRTLNNLVGFSAEELAELDNAIAILKRDNMNEQANTLHSLATKLKTLQKPEAMSRVEPDYEALLEAEGLAMRPGPKPKIDDGVMAQLREAILSFSKVKIHVRYRASGKHGYQIVSPYGFLYGNRHYLVANTEGSDAGTYRLFSLSNIDKVEMQNESFVREDNFSLQAYAENSFGVFQEEPFDVVWKFSANVADDVKEYQFHPRQVLEERPDGSMLVKFKAGGVREMDWHLYTWGSDVEVIEPKNWNKTDGEVYG